MKASVNVSTAADPVVHCTVHFNRFFVLSLTDSKIIRLVNGTSSCSGRVEVYHNAEWGTICDDRWGIPEVIVACHEMNCGNPIAATYKSFYGQGKDQVWMDDVECTGQEKSLADCSHRGFGEHDCDHSEDAGITCSGNTWFVLFCHPEVRFCYTLRSKILKSWSYNLKLHHNQANVTNIYSLFL